MTILLSLGEYLAVCAAFRTLIEKTCEKAAAACAEWNVRCAALLGVFGAVVHLLVVVARERCAPILLVLLHAHLLLLAPNLDRRLLAERALRVRLLAALGRIPERYRRLLDRLIVLRRVRLGQVHLERHADLERRAFV